MIERDELLLEVDRSSFVRLPQMPQASESTRSAGYWKEKPEEKTLVLPRLCLSSLIKLAAQPSTAQRRGGDRSGRITESSLSVAPAGRILMAHSVWLWDLLINFLLEPLLPPSQSPFLFRSNLRQCRRVR